MTSAGDISVKGTKAENLRLFDDIERTDTTPWKPGEPLVAYLNRSARLDVALVRGRLEGWYAHYPTHAKTMGFLGKTNGDFFAKSFELLVHELLMRLDCTILAVEPHVSGNRGKPDFQVAADDIQFYVECTTVNPDHPTLVPMKDLHWEHKGPIGGEVRDSPRILKRLLDKANKHRNLHAPCVIALTGDFFDDDDHDSENALFGHPTSLWIQNNKPVNQHVSAVWMFHRAIHESLRAVPCIKKIRACLYINPWITTEEIPTILRQFSHAEVRPGELTAHYIPGKSVADIIGCKPSE